MKAIILDTEVNGLEAMEVIELSFAEVQIDNGLVDLSDLTTKRFSPAKPFEAGAVATHFILPEQVVDCPPSSDAKAYVPSAEFVIGHNIDFDMRALGLDGLSRICTLALCRHLWPGFRSQKLGAVYLELRGMTVEAIAMLQGCHSAEADVEICYYILQRIVEKSGVKSLPELHALSEVARVPTIMPFGKHRGEKISDLPSTYRKWLLDQAEVDQYLRTALQGASSGGAMF